MSIADCGNVEGVDLKRNNQSTTHIDPQVRTGGIVHVYYWLPRSVTQIDIGNGGKLQAPACSVLAKDQIDV